MPTPQEKIKRVIAPNSKSHVKLFTLLNEMHSVGKNGVSRHSSKWQEADRMARERISSEEIRLRLQNLQRGEGKLDLPRILYPMYYNIEQTICATWEAVIMDSPFRLGSYAGLNAPATYIEQILKQNAMYSGFDSIIQDAIQDGVRYGRMCLLCVWVKESAAYGSGGKNFEGNKILRISPYDFFPDPSVAPHELSTHGQFVFFRNVKKRHLLEQTEDVHHLDSVGVPIVDETRLDGTNYIDISSDLSKNSIMVDQFYCWLDAREYGLPYSLKEDNNYIAPPEGKILYQIWVANRTQIIYASPVEDTLSMIPIVASEPYGENLTLSESLYPVSELINHQMNLLVKNRNDVASQKYLLDSRFVTAEDIENSKGSPYILSRNNVQGADFKNAVVPLKQDTTTADATNIIEYFSEKAKELAGLNDVSTGGLPEPRTAATTSNIAVQNAQRRVLKNVKKINSQLMNPLRSMMIGRILTVGTDELFVKINNRTKEEVITNSNTGLPFAIGDFRFFGVAQHPEGDNVQRAQGLAQQMPTLVQLMQGGFLVPTVPQLFRELLGLLGVRNPDDLIIGTTPEEQQKFAAKAAAAQIAQKENTDLLQQINQENSGSPTGIGAAFEKLLTGSGGGSPQQAPAQASNASSGAPPRNTQPSASPPSF